MVLVSVIIPCFNVADDIEKTLHSITAQTYEELEIILVDDGSEYRLEEMLSEQVKQDKRFNILRHEKNQELSNSRNTGLKNAKGGYVLFWDADDILDDEAIETLVELAEENNSDLVRGVLARSDGEKRWVTKRGRKLLARKDKTDFENSPELTMDFTCCGVLFSKQFLKQHELAFAPNLYMQDILFTARSLIHATNICMTDFIVGDYFQSPQSASRLRTQKRFNSLFELHEKLELEFEKNSVSNNQRNTILAGFINAGVNTFLLWKLENPKNNIADLDRLSNLLDKLGSDASNQYCMDMLDEPSYVRLHATRLQNYSLAASVSSMETVSEKVLSDLFGAENLEFKTKADKFLSNLRKVRTQSKTNNRLVLNQNNAPSCTVSSLIRRILSHFKIV